MLSKQELLQGLTTRVIGNKMFVFETIDSTNACARTLGDTGIPEGAVVLADFQTNGRGRLGRSWMSEANRNLLFSVLLRPSIKIEQAGLLTLFASTAVARAIEKKLGAPVECRWPNDLLMNGKKFSGILLENTLQVSGIGFAVVGIGVNVNQRNFPAEIREKATSLANEAGRELDRKEILHSVLGEMDGLYETVARGEFAHTVSEWTRRCRMFGKNVKVQQHEHILEGTAVGLHDDGGLIISRGAGTQIVYAGDVTLVA